MKISKSARAAHKVVEIAKSIVRRRAKLVRVVESLSKDVLDLRARYGTAPDLAPVVIATVTAVDDAYARLVLVVKDPASTPQRIRVASDAFMASAEALQMLTT
jgi:hypothetical protein